MPGGFTVEYAKSGRSTCKGCKSAIAQGELRIGKMVQSPHFDGEIPLWHHRACLFKREAIASEALLVGLSNLRPDDVKSLKAQCGGGGGAAKNVAVLPPSVSGDRFQTEYAASSRSKCKHCEENIEKDELRVGKMVQSQAFDGMIPAWHHLDCVFKATIIFSAALVDGIDNLRPEDQKTLKELIAKHSPAAAMAGAGAGAAGAATDADGDVAMKAEPKTKGKKSKKRAHDSDDEEEEPAKASKVSVEDYSKLTVAALTALCKEQGLPVKGKKADLVARLEEAAAAAPASSSSSSAAAAAASPASAAAAPADPVKARHEAALEVESSARWKLKDSLAGLSTGEIKALLQANNQPDKGGRDKLMDQLVDGLMYGALPPCSECGHQALTFKDGEYACTGMASEWGRCLFRAEDVKRAEFDVSECDNDAFSKFTFKFQKKPLEALRYFAAAAKAVVEQQKVLAGAADEAIKAAQAALVKKQVLEELFADFDIAFVGTKHFKDEDGKAKSLKELKALAEDHGATITTDIEDADLIITSLEDVAADAKKLKKAQSEKKPILLCTFLLQSVAKAELQDPKDFSAVDASSDNKADGWADLKVKVESGRQKSGAKLAAGAAAAAGKSVGGKSAGGKIKVKVKGRGAVDDDSGLADTGHILEEKDDVYTVTLNLTDITTGNNTYYILQLIETDGRASYSVFRKWGRVGTDIGSNKITDHGGSKEGAKQEFTEVYYEKTGNKWSERKNFAKRPGKFFPIDVDYSADGGDDPLDAAAASSSAASTSKLDKRIQDLMRIFFDVQAIKKTLLEMEIDLEKMPLGKLSRAHIKSGYTVLTEIQEALKVNPVSESKLLALSNQFYTIIPHDFGRERPPILRSDEEIKKKLEMIDTLLEIEIATKMLQDKSASSSDEKVSNDPIDVHYRQLKTDMKVVEQDTSEFGLIRTYITNTHAPTHKNYTLDLLEAFAVDRENEGGRYSTFEKDPNRMLLWHGSRTTNFVGILSQGLRIAPPEAPVTGYMFGKGVYFADMVSKSANYCFTNQGNNIGFLLLCEVALGEMNLLKNAQYMDKAPGSCLSTKGLGLTAPDPKGEIKLENGTVVPAGKPVKTECNSSLLYNEFIVYDVAQIRMKYLLKVRFNYQQRW